MRLVLRVQHGSLRIASHASGTHFMNGQPGGIVLNESFDIARACRGQHLGGTNRHIAEQRALVLTPHAIDTKGRYTPGVNVALIELNVIFVVGQTFTKAVEGHLPGPGPPERVLENRAEATSFKSAIPALAERSTLKSVAAQELWMFLVNVAEARHVDSIRAVAERNFVFVTGNSASRAASHAVIHQIVPKFTARVGKPVRKFCGCRI